MAMERLEVPESKPVPSLLQQETTENDLDYEKMWGEYQARVQKQTEYFDQSVEIVPEPAFVCKSSALVKTDDKGTHRVKAFINICQSELVGEISTFEGTIEALEVKDQDFEQQLRIPMSLGPPRNETEKGSEYLVFDAVFNPLTIKQCQESLPLKEFVCRVVTEKIIQKHDIKLSQIFKFPKKPRYKGKGVENKDGKNQPPPQRIRKVNKAVIEEVSEPEALVNEETPHSTNKRLQPTPKEDQQLTKPHFRYLYCSMCQKRSRGHKFVAADPKWRDRHPEKLFLEIEFPKLVCSDW